MFCVWDYDHENENLKKRSTMNVCFCPRRASFTRHVSFPVLAEVLDLFVRDFVGVAALLVEVFDLFVIDEA